MNNSLVNKVAYLGRVEHATETSVKSRVKYESSTSFCERLKMLDKRFNTGTDSPLHHDNRCNINHKEA